MYLLEILVLKGKTGSTVQRRFRSHLDTLSVCDHFVFLSPKTNSSFVCSREENPFENKPKASRSFLSFSSARRDQGVPEL